MLLRELRGRQYPGSYETVKRFVRPLRETHLHAAVTRTPFETPPGLQSQMVPQMAGLDRPLRPMEREQAILDPWGNRGRLAGSLCAEHAYTLRELATALHRAGLTRCGTAALMRR